MLLQGDCTKLLGKIESDTIDLAVTSPPYDNLREYNGNAGRWSHDKWEEVLKELYRVLKSGGVAVWVVDDQTINGSKTCTSFKQALCAVQVGFNLHDTMIWSKCKTNRPTDKHKRYRNVFEYMFVFSKGKPKTANLIRDRRNKSAGSIRRSYSERLYDGSIKTRTLSNPKVTPQFGLRNNVWEIPSESRFVDHPAVFPVTLAFDHIRTWSQEGDLVLDPFMGSGSTGVACKKLNRKFVGIELDKTYYAVAKRRIEEVSSTIAYV